MACVLITYQSAERSYSDRMVKTIHQLGEAWQPCAFVWLLKTGLGPSQVLSRLRASLHSGDNVLVMDVGHHYATNLPEGSKSWLYQNLR